jgi:hypothetical protein
MQHNATQHSTTCARPHTARRSAALARWFSPGLLQLERITWERSPGALLQV